MTIESLIRFYARQHGVDEDYALRIAKLESDMRPYALGDDEQAVGLYQWHRDSWECACAARGWDARSKSRWTVADNIDMAMWAMAQGWHHWWSTSEKAKEITR